MTMTARRTDLNGLPLIVADGDIDHATCGELEAILEEAISQGRGSLLFDLSNVDYIDSGGLSVLFSAGRQVRDTGWIGLISPNASVRRLLELVGALADPAFRIFEDMAEASAAASGKDTP